MTTPQIVILSIITIVFILGMVSTVRNNHGKTEGGHFAMLITFMITMLISIFALIGANNLAKGCPQYEKVENVYKLK